MIGHRVEEDFPVITLFYKLNKPQSGLELSVQEWNELVQSKSSIREFLSKGTHKPTILLGSVVHAAEFWKYYSKRTVVNEQFCELAMTFWPRFEDLVGEGNFHKYLQFVEDENEEKLGAVIKESQ